MESSHNSGSSANLRTGNSTDSGEGEQFFNSEKKRVPSSSSPFSSELTSQDHFHYMPNETTWTHPSPLGATSPTIHDQTYSQSKMQDNTHSVTEKGDRSPITSHLEANPFGESHHSPLVNSNSALTSSSSQNPFLMPSDATNTTHVSAIESDKLHGHLHSSVPDMNNNGLSTYPFESSQGTAPSRYESSPGNPFEVQTTTTSKKSPTGASVSWKFDEHHDHGNESHHTSPSMEKEHWSMPRPYEARTQSSNTHGEVHVFSSSLDPVFPFESPQNQRVADATNKNHEDATISTNFESHHNFPATEQAQKNSKASSSSNFRTDNKLDSSVSPFFQASESSTEDHKHNSVSAATKAPPKLGKDLQLASESSDEDIPISSFPKHGQQSSDVAGQHSSHSSLSGVSGTNNGSEKQNPPVQVMERPEDATTASKYRFPSHVFARHKSNTQWSTASNESLFSIQMGNTSFSGEMAWMNKSGELDKPSDTNSSTAVPNNQPPIPPQPQPPPTKFNDISQRTAEQHEGSKETEEKAAETMREVIMESSVNKQNVHKVDLKTAGEATCSRNYSRHSNGSTKSFAFDVLTDVDKSLSSKRHGEEKRKQQKQPEQQTLKATPDVAQNPMPTQSASQNKWLCCCFSCCG